MIRQEDVFKIGRIGKPHGVKGEVNFMFDDDVFDRTDAEYLVIDVDGILVPFFMEEYRFRSDTTALVKFCDIDTQDDAKRLTNADVYFERKLADDNSSEPTLAALVGYKIIDSYSKQQVGTVIAVDDSTQNTLIDVKTAHGGTVLIPLSEDLIVKFDNKNHSMTMVIPDGLLDL
jgi:16S rRNA processing protein RimM